MMLLDTSGLLCLHHKLEPLHEDAVAMYRAAAFRLTHNYVLSEFVALANARRMPRVPAIETVRDLLRNPEVTVVWIDRQLHESAVDLLLARRDKTYSLCDAVSFLVMRQHSVIEALTSDHHFEREGFQRLLA
jgi:predicted nucleic acid-binding protein